MDQVGPVATIRACVCRFQRYCGNAGMGGPKDLIQSARKRGHRPLTSASGGPPCTPSPAWRDLTLPGVPHVPHSSAWRGLTLPEVPHPPPAQPARDLTLLAVPHAHPAQSARDLTLHGVPHAPSAQPGVWATMTYPLGGWGGRKQMQGHCSFPVFWTDAPCRKQWGEGQSSSLKYGVLPQTIDQRRRENVHGVPLPFLSHEGRQAPDPSSWQEDPGGGGGQAQLFSEQHQLPPQEHPKSPKSPD